MEHKCDIRHLRRLFLFKGYYRFFTLIVLMMFKAYTSIKYGFKKKNVHIPMFLDL